MVVEITTGDACMVDFMVWERNEEDELCKVYALGILFLFPLNLLKNVFLCVSISGKCLTSKFED